MLNSIKKGGNTMNILSAIFEPPKCSLDIWALRVPKGRYCKNRRHRPLIQTQKRGCRFR